MPSWNIHTAHVERLFAHHEPEDLGIDDANSFLFGNYVPDIYVGFMVPATTYRIDYCITHVAEPNFIPIPDADRFWDIYLARRTPADPGHLSLTLGAWAHLVADRIYNGLFQTFWETHDTPEGEELRIAKQGDFDLFGRSLGIKSHVAATPQLFAAAEAFKPYSLLAGDVERTIEVVDEIVCEGMPEANKTYRLLSNEWLMDTFAACDDWLTAWLIAWQSLSRRGCAISAAQIRAEIDQTPQVFQKKRG